MVNGSRYYRALESVSIASALSTALTIYPCQIRLRSPSTLTVQLPTARKKEWRPATADSSPHAVTCQHCDTVIHTTLVDLEPAPAPAGGAGGLAPLGEILAPPAKISSSVKTSSCLSFTRIINYNSTRVRWLVTY